MVAVGKKRSFYDCYNIFSSEFCGEYKDIRVKYRLPFESVTPMKYYKSLVFNESH